MFASKLYRNISIYDNMMRGHSLSAPSKPTTQRHPKPLEDKPIQLKSNKKYPLPWMAAVRHVPSFQSFNDFHHQISLVEKNPQLMLPNHR
jgi:hypothetical protein